MSKTARCPNCGASTARSDAFCTECGHPLPSDEQTSYGAPSSQPYARYGPSPGATTPRPDSDPNRDDGFFEDLFDFTFRKFVTPAVVRVVYKVVAVVIFLTWLAYVVLGFYISTWAGFLVVILGPLVALFWLIVCRIILELTMVVFRMGADLHVVKERGDLD